MFSIKVRNSFDICRDEKLEGILFGENWKIQYSKCVSCQVDFFQRKQKCDEEIENENRTKLSAL